jgi:hypothetical protein
LQGRQLLVPLEIDASQPPRQVQEVADLEKTLVGRGERKAPCTVSVRKRSRRDEGASAACDGAADLAGQALGFRAC